MDSLTLSRAIAGAPDAQAAFLREVGPQVASLVRRLSDRSDAADDTHDVLAHLLAVLPRFNPDGAATVTTWAFTVAHRWLLMRRRKAKLELAPLDAAVSVPDAGAGPEESARARQLSLKLEAALAKLPHEQRRVFVLAQLHQQKLDDIAALEGVPLGTVKSRLFRAKAELVLLLGDALDRPQGGAHGPR
jgi:RNA polymerase sigma-70 factor (ECF subfamily)